MNKIFMTKRRHDGEIAVCSELTRSKGKMKSFVAAVATAAALAVPVAEAAGVATANGANVVSGNAYVKIETRGDTVAIGNATLGTTGGGKVAIGTDTSANGENSVAVGSSNNANGTQTTVIGSKSNATKQQAIAIGNDVLAAGYSSITIGGDDAGIKDPEKNLTSGANTQYATFVYDATLDEVISNPYSVLSGVKKISIDPKDASDPSKTSQISTRKTIVVVTRSTTETDNNNQVPLLSSEKKEIIKKFLGIKTSSIKEYTNVQYEQEKKKANTVVIDGSMTNEQILFAVLETKDPANYLGRLLEKYKVEAQIAAGDTPLTDEEVTEKAYLSIENLAAEMGAVTTGADGTPASREEKIHSLIIKYYDEFQGTRTTGGASIAIGIKAQSLADGAISLGTAAISRGKESLALGVGAITSGERAIGMGTLSVASGDRSIAIGTYTEAPDTVNGEMRYDAPRALAEDAVAIGSGAYVGLDVSGTKSVALGAGSIVTTGYGDIRENHTKGTWEGILRNYSDYDPNKAPGINEEYKAGTVIASGTLLPKGAKYRTEDGQEVTLDVDTKIDKKVTLLNDVVETHKQFTLGKTTTGGTTGTIDKAYVGRLVYRDFAGATAVGAVSVGYSGAEKRIQNVAAGEISKTSTDAINGSQLYLMVNNITENSPFQYVDGSGNPVVKIGDQYYPAGTIVNQDGNPVNATTGTAAQPVAKNDVVIKAKSTDPEHVTNINGIASSLNTKEVETKPVGTTGTTVTDKLVDLTYPKLKDNPTTEETKKYNEDKAKWESSAVTVGDVAKMGWVVSTKEGNGYVDTVKNANKVNFKGENGISVTGKTAADGTREIIVSLEKGEVVKSNEFKVTITETAGNGTTTDKVVDAIKVGDKYYAKDDIDPTTGKPFDGKNPLTPKKDSNSKDLVENKGDNFVTGNTVADAIQKSGFTVGKQTDTTGVGFNNSDEKVNPDDNLKFADGKGTVVSTGTVKKLDTDGTVSTTTVVKVDVDSGKLTNNPNGSVKGVISADKAKKLADALAAAEKTLAALEALSDQVDQDVKDKAKAKIYDAEKAIEKAGLHKVATVQNVAEAINNSGFKLKTSATTDGENKTTGDLKTNGELINPADTVEMIAGKNMTVKHDTDGKITYATAEKVNFTRVQFGDKGPTINAVDAKDDKGNPVNAISVNNANISNVANGEISATSKDAVNGSQLYSLTSQYKAQMGDIHNKINRQNKELRAGIAGSNAAAGLPQVYIPGKSMIAASAGTFKGQSALAVGYSRASDNGKLILKLQGNANTRGEMGGSVGVGYQW
ncbi:YadA-like family protein [Glaesserella parasuis]|uniref:YadA-like family protein n=1 Tax=Glaesserella parasuis TaxID=738 RepID=UPI001365DE2D|nr:YadA-like family protein [Glaesserella parasuis]MWQ32765.1 hypothetical protein [Glaesserella parasuis]